MDCIVAATTGALKNIYLRDNTFVNLTPIKGLDPKQHEVTDMTWGKEDQSEVLMAQVNREIRQLDMVSGAMCTRFHAEGGEGPIKGLHANGDRTYTCTKSGLVTSWDDKGEKLKSWTAGDDINVMKGNNQLSEVVTGGARNLLKTWDMTTGKQIWMAKNVVQTNLYLDVPIMITDACYLHNNTIVEATKVHELRLYDPRAQRRAVRRMSFMEQPITSVSTCYQDHFVVAANSIGEMGLFDTRSKVHPVCKYKGQAGSIRSIAGHPTEPLVATCGIDRYVRVHDMNTRKLIHKIYCKTRMNKILLRNDLSILTVPKAEEDEDMWEDIKEENDKSDESEDDGSGSDSDVLSEVWDELGAVKDTHEEKNVKSVEKTTKKKRSKVADDSVVFVEEIKQEMQSDDELQPAKKARLDSKTKVKRKTKKQN